MGKRCLLSGISGMDGSNLAELLLFKDYEVYGIIRRNSVPEHQESRISHLEDKITTFYGDLLDSTSIQKIFSLVKPDYIFNTAAQSHVRISFDIPEFTIKTNLLGVLNMLNAFKMIVPNSRFLQTSSSEQFGNSIDPDGFERETTVMHPVSPYGIAKLAAFNLVQHYRRAYKLFACNSICFNHSGPRRGSNFVENKIVKTAVRIKLGLQNKLELGNLDSYRDFGDSRDYCDAMYKIINHSEPDDFVIATGFNHSIRELCEIIFNNLNLNYKDYVIQNEKFFRPEELKYLKGDSSKIRKILRWEPKISFDQMIQEMIDMWMKYYERNKL